MHWRDFKYKEWKEQDVAHDHAATERCLAEATKQETLEGWIGAVEGMPRTPFKPNAFYNEPGDQIEVHLTEDQYYAHWLCPGIELHLSMDTHEIVGMTISGIKHLLKKGEPR